MIMVEEEVYIRGHLDGQSEVDPSPKIRWDARRLL